MRKTPKRTIILLLLCLTVAMNMLSGCSYMKSKLNDIKGKLTGNNYTIYTYDNYGNKTFQTTGKKVNISGNKVEEASYDNDGNVITGYDMSAVITITIDGKEIETCGDTCIFEQKGLKPEVSFDTETINSDSKGITSNTGLAYYINKYKNLFGKSRVVVIKSQMGQPITAYSGDDVYWEIPEELPKTTKLMIDGKALYIHRANFQIIDKQLLE